MPLVSERYTRVRKSEYFLRRINSYFFQNSEPRLEMTSQDTPSCNTTQLILVNNRSKSDGSHNLCDKGVAVAVQHIRGARRTHCLHVAQRVVLRFLTTTHTHTTFRLTHQTQSHTHTHNTHSFPFLFFVSFFYPYSLPPPSSPSFSPHLS